MSARDAMAAMLDELMGPKRNVELGKDTKVTFDDPDICPFFLVGLCPHDLFTNTKADLGACYLVHDDNMRRLYPESPEYGKLGFEKRLLRALVQLDDENMRRIRKNKEKLSGMDDGGRRKLEEEKKQVQMDIEMIEEELRTLIKAAEQAGTEGNVSKCQELVAKSEQIGVDKRALEDRLKMLNEPTLPAIPPLMEEMAIKPMEVCEVCSSMLIVNDAQQRVEEHLTGKMHTGYQKIRTVIQELKEKIKKFDEDDEAKREERRREKRPDEREDRDRDRDRDHDRRRRSRSPHRSNHRDDRRDSRDSYSRRNNYDRRDDRDRRHHRDRRY